MSGDFRLCLLYLYLWMLIIKRCKQVISYLIKHSLYIFMVYTMTECQVQRTKGYIEYG